MLLIYRSRIHERSILLRFLGIIMRVSRLEVYVYNFYITNKFRTICAQGAEGGGGSPLYNMTVKSKEENT
jgi:hypothetical protein